MLINREWKERVTMKATLKKLTAFTLVLTVLFAPLSLPADAFSPYDLYDKTMAGYDYVDENLSAVKWVQPEKNTYSEAVCKDIDRTRKAGTIVKMADVSGKFATNAGSWYHNKQAAKYWGNYEAIKKTPPKRKVYLWKAQKKQWKNLSKEAKGKGKVWGGVLGGTVDAGFAIYGFVDMYNNPKIGFKSPFLEFCGNTLRGAAAAGTFAYRFVKDTTGEIDPRALGISIGLTAVETAFNGETSRKFFNDHVDRIPYLDAGIEWINDFWQTGFDYYFNGAERDIIAKNNAALEELKKKCNGATFQGSGVGVYKPNIYLYPTEETDITVRFEDPSLLTVTDPVYSGEWQVHAAPDGTLTQYGKEYGYLFYESVTFPDYYQTESGFVIPADGREAAFEEILSQYGLNDTEIQDFCDFWCEKLDEGCDYAMYPQLNDTVDSAMPVTITPKPDSTLRVWFAFVKNETPESVPEIEEFEREGYSAVEWGGFFLD